MNKVFIGATMLLGSLAAYAFLLISDDDVWSYVERETCSDIAKSASSRPSATELNGFSSYQMAMNKTEAINWVLQGSGSPDAALDLVHLVYERGGSYQNSLVGLDGTFSTPMGYAREEAICTFVRGGGSVKIGQAVVGDDFIIYPSAPPSTKRPVIGPLLDRRHA